jgi:hypothetical protein
VGSILKGLGGYPSSRTDAEHYEDERQRKEQETYDVPHLETQEVADILQDLRLEENQSGPAARAISSDRKQWVGFMMRFELGVEAPDPR